MFQLRRFQIRFKHEDDFDNVLNTLHELRCNIRESQIRPSTAEQPRPTTTGALQNTFAIPPAPVETARPTSAAATFYRPTASASDIAAYRADPWSQSNHDRSISRGPSFPPPSSQSQQQGLTSFIPPSSQAHTGDFRGANELNHSHYSSNRDSTVPEHPAQHMGLGMSAQRPTSTTFAVNAESASQILPPRRILPFSPSPTKPPPSAAPIPSASSNERPASRKRPASSASTSAPKKPAKARNSRGPMSTVAELEDKLGSKAALAPMDVNKPTPSFRPANAKPSLAEPVTIEVPSSQQAQAGISEHGQASVLHEYATTPTGERQAVIDTMFCQLIADDDFKILCGDVESAWRRIGLGY